MKKLILVSCLLSGSAIAGMGGGGGGIPPAIAVDELMMLSSDAFKALSLEVIQNPDMLINVNGQAAKPLMIDIQSKTIRFESVETKEIIDVTCS